MSCVCVCVCVSALGTVHTGMSCFWGSPKLHPWLSQEGSGFLQLYHTTCGTWLLLSHTSSKTALGRDAELLASAMGSSQWG